MNGDQSPRTPLPPEPPLYGDEWDYDESEPDRTCTNCGGTGGEPYDDYISPCAECDGEGYRWWE